MTTLQREIVELLFKEHTIACYGNVFRLRDNKQNPVRTFTFKTYKPISFLLRKVDKGLYVLDKRIVRQQHGKSWVKKHYKSKQWT